MAEVNYKDAIPTLKSEIEHETVEQVLALDVDNYKYGFETAIETDRAPIGLSEDTIRYISAKKGEPDWMLEWRLDAYKRWLTMDEPRWARVHYPKIDFQDMYYYAAPKNANRPKSLADVDEAELLVRECLGHFRHRSDHVERGADDDVEALAGSAGEARLEVGNRTRLDDDILGTHVGLGLLHALDHHVVERLVAEPGFRGDHGHLGSSGDGSRNRCQGSNGERG